MKSLKAFTLIELLVVIAILAMLLGILTPALNKARDAARTIVCKAHMRPFGIGIATYAMDHDDFLAGPNTSGYQLTRNNVTAAHGATSPVQNVDWISPMLGDSLGLSPDRKTRIREIFDTQLRCPSNTARFDFEYAGSGGGLFDETHIQTMTAASYSASMAFHVYSISDGFSGSVAINEAVANQVYLPRRYVPRLSAIGRPASKIYAFDGTRYIDSDGRISFNSFAKQIQGGNYMGYGPVTPRSGDPFRWTSFTDPQFDDAGITQRFGYRHGGRINVVFFDGRVETLTLEESLDVRYYFPSGSTVRRGRWTYDINAQDGQVIR